MWTRNNDVSNWNMLKHFIYSSSDKSTTSSLCSLYYRYSSKSSSFFCILSFLVRAIFIDQTFYSATHYLAAVWLNSKHDLNNVRLTWDARLQQTRLSFCTSTCLHDAVNWSIFRFIRLMYMHCNHIHCEDMTQSLLIYTKWQQRLCTCVATHIHHTHIYYEDITQLLCTYTSERRSKSINFDFLIDLHASQIQRSKFI